MRRKIYASMSRQIIIKLMNKRFQKRKMIKKSNYLECVPSLCERSSSRFVAIDSHLLVQETRLLSIVIYVVIVWWRYKVWYLSVCVRLLNKNNEFYYLFSITLVSCIKWTRNISQGLDNYCVRDNPIQVNLMDND